MRVIILISGFLLFYYSAQATPLIMSPGDFGSYKIELNVQIDDEIKKFQLDTGGKFTSLEPDDHTLAYPSKGKNTLTGAAGITTECDIVQPRRIVIDSYEVLNPSINRCDFGKLSFNNLGLDLLDKSIFEINFRDSEIRFLRQLPEGQSLLPFVRLPKGHIKIPISLKNEHVSAIFDTGWRVSSVDSLYVKNNKKLFRLIKTQMGTDISGNPVKFKIYEISKIKVGALTFEKVIFAAFDFPTGMREYFGADAPIILGTNVIAKANWILDLISNAWQIQSFP